MMGVYFGAENVSTSANEENEKGLWERRDVRILNDSILHTASCDWDFVSDFSPDAISEDSLKIYRSAVSDIVLNLDAHRPWFVKEPRLCLLFPIWRPVLELPICIHVYRNPLEVACSLKKRNDISIPTGLALWEMYNVRALQYSSDIPRLLVSYRKLMEAPQEVVRMIRNRLFDYGGYDLRTPSDQEIDNFLDKSLYHQRESTEALREVATEDQIRLFESLENTKTPEDFRNIMAFEPSVSCMRSLREYESTKKDTIERMRRANATELRRHGFDMKTRFVLKSHELDRTLVSLKRTSMKREEAEQSVSQLRKDNSEKDRELERMLAKLVETERKREEAEQSVSELERTKSALQHKLKQQTKARIELQEELEQRAIEMVAHENTAERLKRVLDSPQWRLGDAAVAFGYKLLFRNAPPVVPDSLAKRTERDSRRARGLGRTTARDSKTGDVTRSTSAASRPGKRIKTRTVTSSVAFSRKIKTALLSKPMKRRTATVAVIAWDVGHNPLGRAHLLAEVLDRAYNVVLVGFQFSRYGDAVWKPLRQSRVKPVVIPGRNFPEFQSELSSLSSRIDADVVVASKARLPSVQLGLMLKAFRNRPLVIDVDDHELAFFKNREPMESLSGVSLTDLSLPFEETWTRYTESLLPYADELLVSNPALQQKFGGVLIPHARDERQFDPERVDPGRARKWLGLDARHKVVMFVGTPRPHKGVMEVLDAIKAIGSKEYRLVVVGTPPDKWFAKRLESAGDGHLHLVPDQPFEMLPELLSAADLVCLPQDPESEISKYQLPAKAIDAAAMGIPVLATRLPPLEPLIDAGVVHAVSNDTLDDQIDYWLKVSRTESERQSRISRQWFLRSASYDAILPTLVSHFDDCLSNPRPLATGARMFLEDQKSRFPISRLDSASGEMDIVVFWKQNDTGLYGRRFEMIMRHIARRPEVRRIALFDRPISIHTVISREHAARPTDHHRLVLHRSIVRRWGLEDCGKLSYHVFFFNNHATVDPVLSRYPPESGFTDFVAAELDRLSIEPRNAVFWYYPMFKQISLLSQNFKPRLKVVDVVDDHRTWPGRTEREQHRISSHYREVLSDADVAIANCSTVQKSMSLFTPHVSLVPNGCDLDPAPASIDDARFDQMTRTSGPRLGFVGNLERKTDMVLIEKIARQRPNYHLFLIGSTHENPDILELEVLPNVHFPGVVTYPESKTWIAHFDVALIPHLDTEQTRSMHPLKMLVYASQEVPIVSTQIHNLGEFEPYIHVAKDHDSFIQAIDEIVSGHRKQDKRSLRNVVERNSWNRRVDDIMDLLANNSRGPRTLRS